MHMTTLIDVMLAVPRCSEYLSRLSEIAGRFSGVYVDKIRDSFEIHERAYIDRLNKPPRDAGLNQLRNSRAHL